MYILKNVLQISYVKDMKIFSIQDSEWTKKALMKEMSTVLVVQLAYTIA